MACTVLFIHKEERIFVKTGSLRYSKRLMELGFIELMYSCGWQHSTKFPRELKVAWSGNARDFFSKKSTGIQKVIMAYCKMTTDAIN